MNLTQSGLDTLIMVAGHAVYTADDFSEPCCDDSWMLQDFQAGEPPFYIEHIQRGVEIAASAPRSLLVFSGGQTRAEAGPRSEAQSYWLLAQHFAWWQRSEVRTRATTEEFARDSFENLLFGICRFFEFTGQYPRLIIVVSWAFKQKRFEFHRDTIGWPDDPATFQFIGVNDPVDLSSAQKGEDKALADFTRDPFGTTGELRRKRETRNPFNRHHPYKESCKALTGILSDDASPEHTCTDDLPWTSRER